MKLQFGTLLLTFAIVFSSCQKDEDNQNNNSLPATFTTGVFFINEGNFSANNASISAFDSQGAYHADPFYEVNGQPLGDVLQSATWIDGKIFAVLNNSGKIEVINASSFTRSTTISGIDYPRYLQQVSSSKAYFTRGAMAGTVEVLNLNTNTVESSIAVGNGPEQITVSNGRAFVCNSGGWVRDSTVSVINLNSHSVESTIEVENHPLESVVDFEGNIWVLCSGDDVYNSDFTQLLYSTPAAIVKIDGTTLQVEGTYTIGSLGDHPRSIAISNDKKKLFIANNGIYEMNLLSPTTALVQRVSTPMSSVDVAQNGDLWTASVSDFVNPSTVYHYNSGFTLLGTRETGISTSAVVARE
jgi:YVTN family beta-propeller protein